MSNHLAVAAVTATLGVKIQEALARDVASASVRIGRPDDNGSTSTAAVVKADPPIISHRWPKRSARRPPSRLAGPAHSGPAVMANPILAVG